MALPQLKKQQVILIVGGILALAAVFMIKTYLDQQRALTEQTIKEKYKKAQVNQTPVLVAKKDIPRGGPIDQSSLQVELVPNKYVQPQAATSLDRISGMITTVPITKGEQITLTKLTFQRSSDLAAATPVGKRALSISLDDTTSVSGMIKGGDFVDVIAIIPIPMQTVEGKPAAQMTTVPLFQNISVLAVGQNVGGGSSGESRYIRKESGSSNASIVTLALSPQEANIITFVQEQGGKLKLVLRSPSDAKVEPVQLVTWDTLFQYIIPQQMQKKAQEEEPKPTPSSYVEIYRGLNKEKVPLYNK